MNILLFSDLHLTHNNLEECKEILQEISDLTKKYNVEHIYDLGDTFDSIKPSSNELDIFSNFIQTLQIPLTIVVAKSHESINEETSILNHFSILHPLVTIVSEFKDENYMYLGHFIVNESKKRGGIISKDELKYYRYCFLGHSHSWEIIKPNICQIGSCRYVNFDESIDKAKVVVLFENYRGVNPRIHFLALKAPILMKDFILNSNNYNELSKINPKNAPQEAISDPIFDQNSVKRNDTNLEKSKQITPINPPNPRQIDLLCQELDNLPKRTKVRVKIMDFESYKGFLPLVNKYINKFVQFKYIY